LLTGFAFGLIPALRAARSSALATLRAGMRYGSARTQRLRAWLVIIEIAASVVLVMTTGLLMRAITRLQSTDPGFRGENVLTLRTALPLPKYLMTGRRVQYYDRVLEQVRALPGVRRAAFATGLPMTMRGGIWNVTMPGRTDRLEDGKGVSVRYVTPEFF